MSHLRVWHRSNGVMGDRVWHCLGWRNRSMLPMTIHGRTPLLNACGIVESTVGRANAVMMGCIVPCCVMYTMGCITRCIAAGCVSLSRAHACKRVQSGKTIQLHYPLGLSTSGHRIHACLSNPAALRELPLEFCHSQPCKLELCQVCLQEGCDLHLACIGHVWTTSIGHVWTTSTPAQLPIAPQEGPC